ncbi:N-acetylmuramoyl-L-alanine amidase [Streptomyces antimicrobicus]|uniref:N-acetylmuramoyl-L-alanine amidase n=1 Tax=Streptomyces antimicrobicus TaxID=2883108 RepID=A0ABS8BC01_9ACTN|nr:N-acetylmuramoyl-L-alanine amidase [Streptomyces antimicrobicus]MCB5182157.1 N-acetylmuramoyl-L-alanine amidase [Streptomyces antimicrobicus]
MPYDDSPPPPESASSVSPDRPWFARRPVLAVSAAALAPAALASWVLVQVLGGGGSDAAAPQGRPVPASAQSPNAGQSPHGDAKSGRGESAPAPGAGRDASAAPAPTPTPTPAAARGPLTGKVVVIDPGHNVGNFRHTAEIDKQVDVGTHRKECDTTGTTTNAGYKEADFTLDVSRRLRTLLQEQGVKVVLTHEADRPFGPCIDERARIGNQAAADAVVSVHADGVSAGNRGFHVILPAKVKGGAADTAAIVGPSRELGERIAGNFARATGSAPANYLGGGTGLVVRDDLGGLNLSTRPKVFIECGNMRDGNDAALLTDPQWRQKAAQGIANGIVGFLGG